MGELRQLKEMKKQMKEETADLSFHIGFILPQVLHLPGTHPFIHSPIHLSIMPFSFMVWVKEHWQFYKIEILKRVFSQVSYSPRHSTSLASISPLVDCPIRSLKAWLLWCSMILGISEKFGSPYLSYLTWMQLDKHGKNCPLFRAASLIPDCAWKGTHKR